MIKIKKTTVMPAPLTTRGTMHRGVMEANYIANPSGCLAPKSTLLEANSGIYGDSKVKDLLKSDQHNKCCYCEDYVKSNAFGDVEHFRPKGGYQQILHGPLMKPGYYWLAYDWSNLYFSCSPCNQKYKGNYFPLSNDPNGRAIDHNSLISLEEPLLIDPATEDPEDHITFDNDIIKAKEINGISSIRGKACIEAYGLDRTDLTDERREHLSKFKRDLLLAMTSIAKIRIEEDSNLLSFYGSEEEILDRVKEARAFVFNAAKDSGRFACMIRVAYPTLLRL